MSRFQYISIFIFLLASFNLNAQNKDCKIKNKAFNAGEKLSYIISYNWFVVFTEVGLVDFTIKNDTLNDVSVYHYRADGRTFNWWDKVFRVRDSYESWVRKEDLRPIAFQRKAHEGDYRQQENYTFEGDTLVYRKNRTYDNPHSYDTIPINPCSFDVMSALLYTRNLDYRKYQVGEKIPITVVLDEKPYDIYFRYLGIEDKKVKDVGTFECLKFTLLLVEGSLFREDAEDMFLWVTNDRNHIPIAVESPIIIGSVKGRITNIKGNRYPLSSKKAD